MSGFWGIVNFEGKPVEREELSAMESRLEITNLDQSDSWINGHIGFGHKMKYFTPESFHEQLPFYDSISELTITSDTRIDNRADIAKWLEVSLSQKNTITDSQLILKAYQKWGIEFAQYLIGDFSIVIWDQKNQQLVLSTDHWGQHPIYYHSRKDQFLFSSELNPITALIKSEVNYDKVCAMVVLEKFYCDKKSTYIKDVWKIEPATTLVIKKDSTTKHIHWTPDLTKRLSYKKESDLIEGFREVFYKAVEDRIRTPFPVATMLSGGLDSSSINAVASHILKDQNKELHAVAGILPESSKSQFTDELNYINAFRSFENIQLHYTTAEGLGPFSGVREKLSRTLSPDFSSRHYLYDAISEVADQHQARVLLDGAYGELGPSYHGDRFWLELFKNGQLAQLRTELLHFAKQEKTSSFLLFGSKVIRPFLQEKGLISSSTKAANSTKNLIHRLPINKEFLERYSGMSLNEIVASSATFLNRRQASIRYQQVQNIKMAQGRSWPYMNENHILHSTPFSDKRVLEFSLAAPSSFKVHNGWKRYMLRASLEGILPPIIQWRNTKVPFSPDFALRYNRQHSEVYSQLQKLQPSPTISQIIDLSKMIDHTFSDLSINLQKEDQSSSENSMNTLGIYLLFFLQELEKKTM